jgi:hypothetical protein
MNAMVPVGSSGIVPQGIDEAIRLAKALSTIPELPEHLHDSVGTCLMIVDQAMRWRMSPFAVAQCSFSIKGKLGFEGKLMAAAVESMGAIVGGFDYQFDGAGDDRTVTVSATRAGETAPRAMKIRLGDVKTTNEVWKKQPDQQLVYSGSRNWARRWTPAALLGAYAPEEFDRPTPEAFSGTTIEAEPTTETKPEPSERDRLNASVPLQPEPEKKTWAQWAEGLEIAARDANNSELGQLLAKAEVVEIVRLAGMGQPSPAKARILAAHRTIEERYLADPPDPEGDGEDDWP